MDVATHRAAPRARTTMWVALFAGLVWCVLNVLLSPSSASAEERGSGSGALGALGGVVTQVGDVVESADAAVAQTVERVAAPLPAPVAEVAPVVTKPVAQVVAKVDTVASHVVSTAGETVTHVVGSRPVEAVVAPVVDTVVELPVVGKVVDGLGVDDTVTDMVETVDETVGTVVGAVPTPGGLLPDPSAPVGPIVDEVVDGVEAPQPGTAAPTDLTPAGLTGETKAPNASAATPRSPAAFERAQSAVQTPSLVLPAARSNIGAGHEPAVAPALGGPADERPLEAPRGPGSPSSSASGSGAHPGGSETSLPGGTVFTLDSRLATPTGGAAVPASPVFDTDVSPD